MKDIIIKTIKQPDKQKHFVYSVGISFGVAMLYYWFREEMNTALLVGFFISILIGFGKEICDKLCNFGQYENADLISDTLGTICGTFLAFLLIYFT